MKSSWELWEQKWTRRQFPKQSFHIQHTGGAEFSQQSFQDGIVHKKVSDILQQCPQGIIIALLHCIAISQQPI